MQTIAEIKAQIRQLELKVINYQTSSFVVLLTAEQKADFEAAEKELDILYKKERLEELRAEIQSERISTGELLELQSLAPYIDKGDVELLEWAGVGEEQLTEENIDITLKYTEDEPEETYYIEYLNAAKRHQRDRADFKTYNEAVIWGRANFENFNSDMIRINQ
jgi:hypothetical protein